MTDLIISFDSEDYLTPQAANAELWWAQALSRRGLRGSFQLVGELVRALRHWQRQDVIDAIAHHEIGFHTNRHSQPPTHPEALQDLSLREGIAHVLRKEAPGLATIAEVFGRWPVNYCAPGGSWTPATLLAMARMGLGVFCNCRLTGFPRMPLWYCGMLVSSYDLDFQDFYEEARFMPGAFEQRIDELVAATPTDGVVVLYTHPTRLVTADFWDQAFAQGRRRAITDCPPAPLRPADEVERYQRRCAGWLDWLAGRRDLRCIDFATLLRERSGQRRDLAALLAEHDLPPGAEGDLPLRLSGSETFMPSAAFDAMRYAWLPYPPGFTGAPLIEQARRLSWTAAPAPRAA
jgi:peptidoglycan/xylan/chitin deacetylase (PgdA/CDA1 family)